MPILAAALVPNLTLLVPNVAQDQLLTYSQTVSAYQDLARHLKDQQVETVVIISSRGITAPTGLAINLHPEFKISFEAFGDLATELSAYNNFALIDHLKQGLGTEFPLSMLSLAELDYGSAVPLVYFLDQIPKLKVVTIYPSAQGLYTQSELGAQISAIIHAHPNRTALIASSNLSSRLADSPLGYLAPARGHDKQIINGFETDDYRFLHNFPAEDINTYYEQGLSAIAMFSGAINRFHKTVKLASYEHPQGLGAAIIRVDLGLSWLFRLW